MVLPDLEQQRKIEELSRIVMRVHDEVQREAEQQDDGASSTVRCAAEGACGGASGAEAMEEDHGAPPDSGLSGPSGRNHSSEALPFVLPLGVMARNEVYPRTCRKW